MRWVMVRVLPVPAPASTHTGPRGGQHRRALLVVQSSSDASTLRRPTWRTIMAGRPTLPVTVSRVADLGNVTRLGYVETP